MPNRHLAETFLREIRRICDDHVEGLRKETLREAQRVVVIIKDKLLSIDCKASVKLQQDGALSGKVNMSQDHNLPASFSEAACESIKALVLGSPIIGHAQTNVAEGEGTNTYLEQVLRHEGEYNVDPIEHNICSRYGSSSTRALLLPTKHLVCKQSTIMHLFILPQATHETVCRCSGTTVTEVDELFGEEVGEELHDEQKILVLFLLSRNIKPLATQIVLGVNLKQHQAHLNILFSYLGPVLLFGIRIHVGEATEYQGLHQCPLHGAGQHVQWWTAAGKLLRQTPPVLTLDHNECGWTNLSLLSTRVTSSSTVSLASSGSELHTDRVVLQHCLAPRLRPREGCCSRGRLSWAHAKAFHRLKGNSYQVSSAIGSSEVALDVGVEDLHSGLDEAASGEVFILLY
ncbi:hypothetical protein DNTS_000011 [Danionella cerebrum]|uniref:Uncharacterized protein n=1 Tax=Danionella cerebrum TaxID=2873325 RepID=A0A553QIL7_9TELE|nr:hypothetical protein DNTS_000011 [Danionella translucida]